MKLLTIQTLIKQKIEKALDKTLSLQATAYPKPLYEAMRYATLSGGKRLRGLFVFAVGQALQVPEAILLTLACSIELIHAYSLVHDDLPFMDNDDWRRGKPACHKVFGEGNAILAGNALHNLAYEIIASPSSPLTELSDKKKLEILHCLSIASGAKGIAGGQCLDLLAIENNIMKYDISTLNQIYYLKTGRLMQACFELPSLAAPSITSADYQALQSLGASIGILFQIQDDIMDVESSTEMMGKPQGSDQAKQKITFPRLIGIENTKQKAKAYYESLQTQCVSLHLDTKLMKVLLTSLDQRQR